MDINKVWLSGKVLSDPILTRLPSKTPFSTFQMLVNESFYDRQGVMQVKPNIIRIEALGKSAETVVDKVQQGGRYYVDGYLRQDNRANGIDEMKVRIFAVYKERSNESQVYGDGLKQALEILKKSRDLDAAVSTLEDLLKDK